MELKEFKNILSKFPRIELGITPTPIHRLKNMEKKTKHNPIYIKRDDLNGIGIGGNKLRGLEYLFGDAITKNMDTIVASGQIQSNMCSLAAAACRYANLDCVIVHNNDKPNRLEGNAILNNLLKPNIRYVGEMDEFKRAEEVEKIKEELIREGKKPYIILNGTSTPLGCLGYVSLAIEFYEQINKENLNIKNVCIPGGNGGLAAGLIYGVAILGRPFHLDLITVEHEKDHLRNIIKAFIGELEKLVGIEFPYDLDEVVTIHDEYRDGGWGVISDEVANFIYEFAQTEGIFVEKVYTCKTIYGMNDMLKKGYFKSGVCFYHSGGIGALFSQY